MNNKNIETLTIDKITAEKINSIQETISRLVYNLYMISAIIDHNKGNIDNFERVAASITIEKHIKNVIIAPGGVVDKVYPLYGNGAIMGLNLFAEEEYKSGAEAAKEKGRMVLGGPFVSAQGNEILVGYLPVYDDVDENQNRFWGLVCITLKYHAILEEFNLESLALYGLTYELWKINPKDGKRQIIASNGQAETDGVSFIERNMHLFNAEWHLRISTDKKWYEYHENLLMILVSVLVSFLIAFITQKSYELRIVSKELERLAHTDTLTGTYNRHYFTEFVSTQIERIKRTKEKGFIVLFDLDFFKKVNDTYGHTAGDEVLKVTASRIKLQIRPYDVFARYGGEEFILFIQQIDKEGVCNLVERCRKCLESTPVEYEGHSIIVTASFGIAEVISDEGMNIAVTQADVALYRAKKEGRNRYILHETRTVADLM
ncbi:MAG: sensor domain-containing diguanylate cyclase [Desulfovibrio sp.]|jgi:diguanylate cyclase (GGDEF)-like protein|nr:sensor domain-containing diguanylate cyclase [Desulfovibrio sp.]